MIAILIFSGLGVGALAFSLRFLAALIREPRSSANLGHRPVERSLAVTLMDEYQRKKRAASTLPAPAGVDTVVDTCRQ